MNSMVRKVLGKVPGAHKAAAILRQRRHKAAEILRLRRHEADRFQFAPAPKLNHGSGEASAPFEVKSGVSAEDFAELVSARNWFHTFKFTNGVVAPGPDPSHEKTRFLGMPASFEGLSVLDIGTYDGWYAFEAARRGAADVLATDEFVWTWPELTARSNFEFVREHTGLNVRDQLISVENLTPEAIGGVFDVTFFFGVLYHAPDPLGYLKRVRSVTGKYALIETVVDMLHIDRPALAYYPGDYLNSDASNHFGPNLLALVGLLQDAGFSRIDDLGVWRQHEVELTAGQPLPDGRVVSGRSVVRAWV